MSLKILVLILAASLLGAGSPCRCAGEIRVKATPSSCGHCPKETPRPSGGCPDSDCHCVHEGSDRASEDQFSIPWIPVAVEADGHPPAPPPAVAVRSIDSTELGDAHRRARPPLYILFHRFTI